MIYLYLKTHNKTGLKYLGKTTGDPFKYNGSGKYWKRHLKRHVADLTTEILFQSEDPIEFKEVALKYSEELNIVESKDFANIIPESGDGGAMPWTKESRKKLSETMSGKKKSEEGKLNMKAAQQKRSSDISSQVKIHLSDKENYDKRVKQLRASYDAVKVGQSISKLNWYNNGTIQVRSISKPDSNWIEGRLPFTIKKVTCPHCGKLGGETGMKRWHFDKCKFIS